MTFTDEDVERYSRQLVLAEIGGPGQQKLRAASVLIVGCGGVGGPTALYLAAAGVGRIGLIDPDEVALSNLHRQIQFGTGDIGRAKTDATAERLAALNPSVTIELIPERLTEDNARDIIRRYDIVVDGTDDFPTRLTVNAACLKERRPLVSGALGRWSGHVGVFTGLPCYRCLVSEVPPEAETCARVGVVGALAGVIGSMAALEVVKLVTGAGAPLIGRLAVYDALRAETRTARVLADPGCPACAA